MVGRVVLVRSDVSEECIASIIRVTRIGELGTTILSSETPVLIRVTLRRIPENGILHSNRC
jgi:demethoxyubiquinone hydroxylase (CLK1/Coq7/Cat5 family)